MANTRDGLAAARARGSNGGRPKLNRAQAEHAQQLYDGKQHTVAQIAALLGVARTTVYGYLASSGAVETSTSATPATSTPARVR